MANIRPKDLPAAASVAADGAFVIDNGATVEKATAAQIVDSAIPLASQAEAEAGVDNATRVSPLRVKQAIDALGVSQAALAGPGGATGIGYLSPLTGAVARDVQDRLAESASIFDFISPAYHAGILAGTDTHDLTAAIQAGLDTGQSFVFPGGPDAQYTIAGQIKISGEKQTIRSNGARLKFTGTDGTKNAIEILSTRRDTGTTSPTRVYQEVSGFRITGPTTAAYASIFFVEEGCFHPFMQRILSEAGTNKGYLGTLTGAFFRINGNSNSYVNDFTIRDCAIQGVKNGTDYPPIGIWVEGAIESRVENTKVFYYNDCMRLGDTAGLSRNIQQIVFDQLQIEPTKPTAVSDGQNSVNIYSASECTFTNCKLDPGNGAGSGNSRSVKFSAGGDGARNIRFQNCDFQGFGFANYAFEVAAGASAHGVRISGGTLNDFALGRVLNSGGQAQIEFDANVTYYRMVPKREKMQARKFAFAAQTVANGPTDNATTVASFAGIYTGEGVPALASLDVSANFSFLEPYRTPLGTWKVKSYQQSGSSRAIAAGNLYLRPFRPEEIFATSGFTVDYASITSGAVATSAYVVPGARLGLPVLCTFYDGVGQEGMVLEAYATGNDAVTVVRANMHSAAVDLASGSLVISVIQPKFDFTGSVPFDINTVAAGARGTTSVSIADAVMGDALVAWYSHDQAGLIIRPRMSTNGTVAVEIINRTGSTPTSVAGTIYVGGYKRPTAI